MTDQPARRRRGRPRALHTIERDRRLIKVMNVPDSSWTIVELAEKMRPRWEPRVVYGCMRRLMRMKIVEKAARTRYRLTGVSYPTNPT